MSKYASICIILCKYFKQGQVSRMSKHSQILNVFAEWDGTKGEILWADMKRTNGTYHYELNMLITLSLKNKAVQKNINKCLMRWGEWRKAVQIYWKIHKIILTIRKKFITVSITKYFGPSEVVVLLGSHMQNYYALFTFLVS